MNAFRIVLALVLGACCAPGVVRSSTLETAEAVCDALSDPANDGLAFTFTGALRSYYPTEDNGWICTIGDATNEVEMLGKTFSFGDDVEAAPPVRPGDLMRATGFIKLGDGKLYVCHTKLEQVSACDPDTIPLVSPEEIYRPGQLHRLLRMRGIVRDAAPDDSDPNFIHLTLADVRGQAQVMVIQPTFLPVSFLHLIGSEVIACGICSDNTRGLRRHVGRLLAVSGLENVTTVTPPKSFADAPELKVLARSLPRTISGVGFHRTEGTVLASWSGDTFLLKTDGGNVVRVRLQDGTPPEFGTRVETLGLPVTDYYHINLIHAAWQPSPRAPAAAEPPRDTTPRELLFNAGGFPQLMIPHHGETIRLTGIVRYLPGESESDTRLQIECDGRLVSVEMSALTPPPGDLGIGCRVSVSGICVMIADDWHIDSTERPEPGFFLVPRSNDDLVILTRPSWWTPGRLLALFVTALVALLGTVLWNVSLNRRANRRGRELAEEQLARVSSELKVGERTRLAVELHDALSQTLTGISMQIDTAAGLAPGGSPALSRCLELASRTIDACRLELKDTLWDLRSAALDETSLDAAIRKTLCQNLSGVTLSVRFNVPREALSDNTTHALLKIIRELASNSLRHGKATSLRIAGAIDGGRLHFSVTDNGSGFDPDLAPGVAEGHFGLQGIVERLERLNGEIKIESAPGRGSRISGSLPLPDAEK